MEEFKDDLVTGKSILGILYSADTFVSDGTAVPQIQFDFSPASLLFVYGPYALSNSSLEYSGIKGYFRLYSSNDLRDTGLQNLWDSLSDLNEEKVSGEDLNTLEERINGQLNTTYATKGYVTATFNDNYIPRDDVGQPNGIPYLDASRKIPLHFLHESQSVRVFKAENVTQHLATQSAIGDIVVRTDERRTYIHSSDGRGMQSYTVLAYWEGKDLHFTPYGNLLSTDVQQAIQELEENKVQENDPRLSDAREPLPHNHPLATPTESGYISSEQSSKLNTLEDSATRDQSPQEILDSLKTVDGSSSGLDADLFQNRLPSTFADSVRKISTGTYLTGGGDLTSDKTLNVSVAANGESSSTKLTRADDARLSNSRSPTGVAGGDLLGSYPNPSLKATAFLVQKNISQTLSPGTWTIVGWNREEFDTHNAFNLSNNQFVAPRGGLYYLGVNIRLDFGVAVSNTTVRGRFTINDTTTVSTPTLIESTANDRFATFPGSAVLRLTQGDVVKFESQHEHTSSADLQGNPSFTYFNGFYIGE